MLGKLVGCERTHMADRKRRMGPGADHVAGGSMGVRGGAVFHISSISAGVRA